MSFGMSKLTRKLLSKLSLKHQANVIKLCAMHEFREIYQHSYPHINAKYLINVPIRYFVFNTDGIHITLL